ncbi:CAMK/CAMKL/KIN1 protein kinase [Nematocida ausubeli]|uniref:CAMK/CAMKL/KIN1 protein kinase n=1 Tax=Nematocida ausubeli (strain ATCC PRA-371 / ERTm2) TaxID=1913371 RepID=H8ZBA8_NEMA1|nr:CAMK/CAMKL/KIN1 protein kinase [Nematocida ausubeli]
MHINKILPLFVPLYSYLLSPTAYIIIITQDCMNNYILNEIIESGTTSTVYKAHNVLNNKVVAIKIINRNKIGIEKKVQRENRILREVLISYLLSHPNILKLEEFKYTKDHFYLIFKYIKGNQLLNEIIKYKVLSEDKARKYFIQILDALNYIHNNNIVHRDIKIENILIDQNDNAILIDFGLSNIYEQNKYLNTFCGSLYFAAPELLSGHNYIGPEVDVYSLGVVLYVMVVGCVPYDDKNISNLYNKIMNNKVRMDGVSDKLRVLLCGMLDKNGGNRMSVRKIYESEWVKEGLSEFGLMGDPRVELANTVANVVTSTVASVVTSTVAGAVATGEVVNSVDAVMPKNTIMPHTHGIKDTNAVPSIIQSTKQSSRPKKKTNNPYNHSRPMTTAIPNKKSIPNNTAEVPRPVNVPMGNSLPMAVNSGVASAAPVIINRNNDMDEKVYDYINFLFGGQFKQADGSYNRSIYNIYKLFNKIRITHNKNRIDAIIEFISEEKVKVNRSLVKYLNGYKIKKNVLLCSLDKVINELGIRFIISSGKYFCQLGDDSFILVVGQNMITQRVSFEVKRVKTKESILSKMKMKMKNWKKKDEDNIKHIKDVIKGKLNDIISADKIK